MVFGFYKCNRIVNGKGNAGKIYLRKKDIFFAPDWTSMIRGGNTTCNIEYSNIKEIGLGKLDKPIPFCSECIVIQLKDGTKYYFNFLNNEAFVKEIKEKLKVV